ncbi:hypothetical protein AaE_008002 [Aphanomyces astaci]|uniref:Dynein heavy chain C-terminal domain-containing protein n=1 Tax=Aphanomyces astaci TaxID=112090 RepID=A0A6A5A939_APHAT|nr:hypothetical protein AaE_008002 [Aphanomyces astaci]
MFADLLFKGLLAWLDDMLGYAETPERPSPHDLLLLLPEAQPEEIRLLPDQGRLVRQTFQLKASSTPPQEFKDCVRDHWMRSSIPYFTELVAPLRQLPDAATKQIRSAKKTKLTRVQLPAVGWDVDHLACFDKIKEDLFAMVPTHGQT